MLRHASILIWTRRYTHRLLLVEIAAAFVVTFVLTAIATNLLNSYRRPLGFEYENVWSVKASVRYDADSPIHVSPSESNAGTLSDVVAALSSLPRTEMVAPTTGPPFGSAGWTVDYQGENNARFVASATHTTAETLHAIGVELVEGRWVGPQDVGQDHYRAALVNRAFVDRAFGPNTNPIGRRIDVPYLYNSDLQQQYERGEIRAANEGTRIVGVIRDFRQEGPFSESAPYVIEQFQPYDAQGSLFFLALKVLPGTPTSYQEKIVETIESVAPGWVATITPWTQLREAQIAQTLLPLKAAATIAAFFIALVIMGLIGVTWQDVVRRTQEIGLRRAVGAAAGSVRRQILGETLIVGSLGIAIGIVIALQFPLLRLVDRIDWVSTAIAIVLSTVFVLMLVLVGALYPSWLASRREPADALRYE